MTKEQRMRVSEAHIGQIAWNKGLGRPVEERFSEMWMPEPYSGCWLWTGATTKAGYGKFGKPTVSAHRASWKLHKGEIPEGSLVLHRCDTRACVNPDHLFIGTQRDNIMDSLIKGRQRIGENHGNSKLTQKQVTEIRGSSRPYKLGRSFGVTDQTVWRILHKTIWKHLL